MRGEAMSVSLFRPWPASVPRITPSVTPGFRAAAGLRQASTIRWALFKNRAVSMPIVAAGTMPKFESAENRPPISGTP